MDTEEPDRDALTATVTVGALRGTGFGRLWTSTGAANLADGLLLAGLPVLATTVTDSPAAIAGVTVALMLPMVLAALPAGAVADRADRRWLLIVGNAGRAATLLGLLVVVAALDLRLAVVYAIAVAASSSEVLVDTTAQTAVPGLVPDDRLDAANARLMVTQMLGNHAVGAPVGAALAAVSATTLLGPSVGLYAVAALAAAWLRLSAVERDGAATRPAGRAQPRATTDTRGRATTDARVTSQVRTEVVTGLRHLQGDDVLRRLAVANALSNLGNTAFTAVLVVFVIGPLGLPAAAYGALLAAAAAGGLVSGVGAERILRRLGPTTGVQVGFAVAALAYAGIVTSRNLVVVAALVAVLGAASMVVNVAARTLRQRRVPDALLGRVTASMAAVALVATPLGAVLGGLVAEWVGVSSVGWLAAGANAAALLTFRPKSRTGPVRGRS